MRKMRLSRGAILTVAFLGVAWTAVWMAAATSNSSAPRATVPIQAQRGDVESMTDESPTMTDREKATFASLIAVVNVASSEPYLMPPNDARDLPAGVGIDYTLFTLDILQAVKTNVAIGEQVVVRQLGTPGTGSEDGPDSYLRVGGRYFVVVAYYDDVYFFPATDFFVEITSPAQEAELIAKFSGFLLATPLAGDGSTQTPSATAAVKLTATEVSQMGTPEATKLVDLPPIGSPVVEPEQASPASQ